MLEAYGVWQEKNLYGQKSMGIVRTTYIIDPTGKIRNVFPKVKVEGHAQEILAALKS
jgi:peroxiredoxin Q/BCP